jgi:cbb3-type cytochrome oxidase maturation protein
MDSLYLTLPATVLLAAVLVALVIRSVRRGDLDDPEGPKYRMLYDDDDEVSAAPPPAPPSASEDRPAPAGEERR